MGRAAYILKTSWIRMVRNYKASFILLVSFYAGLILPAFCMANARYYQVQTEKQHFKGYEKTVHVSYMSPLYGSEELARFMQALDTKTAQLSVRNWGIIPEFENGNATLLGIGGDYHSFEDIHVVQGRSFSKSELSENNKICTVAKDLLDENGYQTGDSITIEGEKFTVIGSMDDSRYTGYILLPYVKMKEMYPNAELQITIDFMTEDVEQGLIDAENYLKNQNAEVDIVLLQKYQANAGEVQSMVKEMMTARIIWGLSAYVFSAVNIAMFVFQRMYESKKRYAIQEVNGMSLNQLFAEILAENILLVLIANLLILLTINPLGKVFRLQNEMSAGWSLFIPLLSLSVGLCMVLSIVLIFRYKRLTVNEIMIEEG